MKKRLKMCLYGEPGVGKSTFASKAPKPFFITTDGNYEWLENVKEEDHVQVSTWDEAKKVFKQDFSNYETIVVDLTEDLFKFCEKEFCIKNRIDHVSDIGYGKGYDITRNDFFIEMCKLIGLDKHIIFIMHGITTVVKDRRGVEHTKYCPSNRLPDKVLDMIEGRVRYFLRCYLKAETGENDTIIKKRYLSLVPKENEFGISRGIDENSVPHDIPLDFDTFANIIGLDTTIDIKPKKVKKVEEVKEEQPKEEIKEEPKQIIETIVENSKEEEKVETKTEEVKTKEEKVEPQATPKTSMSNEDKLAAIRAKMAALKAAKK